MRRHLTVAARFLAPRQLRRYADLRCTVFVNDHGEANNDR